MGVQPIKSQLLYQTKLIARYVNQFCYFINFTFYKTGAKLVNSGAYTQNKYLIIIFKPLEIKGFYQ